MIKLAIDLGSSVTKIYRADAGSGVVLAEPSCVAVSGVNREITAIGKDAKKLVGKTAEFTEIVFPVYEGEIVDMRLAEAMLKEFLSRIGIRPSVLKRSFTVFSVPCGASAKLREDYAALAEECGLKRLCFVEAPFLAALGADAVLSEANPVFCLDIGGGVTNAAVLSLDGIIAGLSMNVGGNNMDANIIDRIEACKGLHIGALTAERVKNEIGSLAVGARGATVVEGSLVSAMRPGSVSVQASEIEPCIRIYIDKILEYASLVLQKTARGSRGGGQQQRRISLGRRREALFRARIYREETRHEDPCLRRTAVCRRDGRRSGGAGRTDSRKNRQRDGRLSPFFFCADFRLRSFVLCIYRIPEQINYFCRLCGEGRNGQAAFVNFVSAGGI